MRRSLRRLRRCAGATFDGSLAAHRPSFQNTRAETLTETIRGTDVAGRGCAGTGPKFARLASIHLQFRPVAVVPYPLNQNDSWAIPARREQAAHAFARASFGFSIQPGTLSATKHFYEVRPHKD